jgi:hypothetical protein
VERNGGKWENKLEEMGKIKNRVHLIFSDKKLILSSRIEGH